MKFKEKIIDPEAFLAKLSGFSLKSKSLFNKHNYYNLLQQNSAFIFGYNDL